MASRARGVSVAAERGHRFRGRRTALTEIVTWLDRPGPDRKVLVITGSPGVGKSAVLGRIVTTADAEMRATLPPDDDAVRAGQGTVACAVHAKGKTALDVAMEIARAASAPLPDRVDDLPTGLRKALAERDAQRFNLVIDALDEASDPTQARVIINGIVLPIAATCAEVGAQVVRPWVGGELPRRVHRRVGHRHVPALPPGPQRRPGRRPGQVDTPEADEAVLTRAFTGYGTRIRLDRAPTYLFRSLPAHAEHAGMVDDLLADTDYVLHADLRRLIPAAAVTATPVGAQRAHLLGLTPRAIATDPSQRLALLSVTETLDDLGTVFRHHHHDAPYRGLWASALHRQEQTVLEGHTGGVNGVCAVRVGGRELLASASDDGTVRLWDPATGTAKRTLDGHTGGVRGVCAVQA